VVVVVVVVVRGLCLRRGHAELGIVDHLRRHDQA
jgi:hypothetical protein